MPGPRRRDRRTASSRDPVEVRRLLQRDADTFIAVERRTQASDCAAAESGQSGEGAAPRERREPSSVKLNPAWTAHRTALCLRRARCPRSRVAGAQGPEFNHTSEKLDPSLERLEGSAFVTLESLTPTLLIW